MWRVAALVAVALASEGLAQALAASTRVGYVRAETTFDPEELDGTPGLPPIPGVNDTTDFARVRVDAVFDLRDVRNRAHRGTLVHGTWLRMDQRGGTLYGFDRFELDLRGFVSTPSKRHTLAVRVTGTYAAFYDGGKIWGGVEALGSQGYRDSAGASARWVSEKDVIVRAFGAYGGEGWRFSVSGSFPF